MGFSPFLEGKNDDCFLFGSLLSVLYRGKQVMFGYLNFSERNDTCVSFRECYLHF